MPSPDPKPTQQPAAQDQPHGARPDDERPDDVNREAMGGGTRTDGGSTYGDWRPDHKLSPGPEPFARDRSQSPDPPDDVQATSGAQTSLGLGGENDERNRPSATSGSPSR